MTTQELIDFAGQYPLILLLTFAGIPLFTWLSGFVAENCGENPWKWFYSVIVHISCIPGVFAAVLLAYSILFIRQNLLQVNALIYFLPLVSMAITLALVGRKVSFEELPGFDRLSGLVVLIAATFVVILALERTRIWLLFGGSMGTLLVAAALIYSVLKWAASRICGGRNEPNADAGPTAG